MPPTPELKKKLKMCELEIRDYTTYLQLENAKLQRRIAKLEAEKVTSDNRIRALKKEIEKRPNRTLEEIISGSCG